MTFTINEELLAAQLQNISRGTLFFSYYNNNNSRKSRTINSRQVQEMVTTGEWKNDNGQSIAYITAQARQCKANGYEKGYEDWKKLSPAFTPCVLCNPDGGHSKKNIVSYTGLLVYDIDHLSSSAEAHQLRQTCSQQPYTYASWVTTSGCGVRLIVRYMLDEISTTLLREKYGRVALTPQDYNTIWKHEQPLIERVAGCMVDTATQDASRLSYFCHDPQAYFDLSAHTNKNSLMIGPEVLNPLPPAKECAAAAMRLPLTTDPHERTLHYLESIGLRYILHHRNNYLYAYARSMFRYGVSETEVHQRAAQIASDLSQKERNDTVNSAYRGVSQNGLLGDLKHLLDPSRTHAPQRSKRQEKEKESAAQLDDRVEEYFKSKYYFVRNTRTGTVQYCTLEEALEPNPLMRPYKYLIKNSTLNDLWREVNKTLGIHYAKHNLENMLFSSAVCKPYKPLTDYMTYCEQEVEKRYGRRNEEKTNPYYLDAKGNPLAVPWKPEEDEIMKYFSAIHSPMDPDIRLRACAMWAVSIAATVFEPKRKGQIMLILQGTGGIGKSLFLNCLQPKHHPDQNGLFTTIIQAELEGRLDPRGFNLKLAGNLICLLDEYSYASPKGRNFLKNVVTSTLNQQRVLYDNATENLERTSTFCATTNEEFLIGKEMAEMRRSLVIPVTDIDRVNGEIDIDDIQFYGQVMWLYRHGMQYWFEAGKPTAFEKALFEHAENYTTCTPEEELIGRYLYAPDSTPTNPESGELLPLIRMSATDILNELANLAPAITRIITWQSLGGSGL